MTERSDHQTSFGPQWLAFSQKESSFLQDDESRYGPSATSPSNSRNVPPSLEKLGRSKSSPLLINQQDSSSIYSANPHSTSGVFTLLKERNTFDRNFPTLGPRKAPPKSTTNPSLNGNTLHPSHSANATSTNGIVPLHHPSINGNHSSSSPSSDINTNVIQQQPPVKKPTESAWKQVAEKPAKSLTVSTNSSSPISPTADSGVSSIIRTTSPSNLFVPSPVIPVTVPPPVIVPPSKSRNRVELVLPKKAIVHKPTMNISASESEKVKQRYDPSLLRKASSEPNLPITPEDVANFDMKLIQVRGIPQKAPAGVSKGSGVPETIKTKPGVVNIKRNDFFQGLIKKEQQQKNKLQNEEAGSEEKKLQEEQPSTSSTHNMTSLSTSPPHTDIHDTAFNNTNNNNSNKNNNNNNDHSDTAGSIISSTQENDKKSPQNLENNNHINDQNQYSDHNNNDNNENTNNNSTSPDTKIEGDGVVSEDEERFLRDLGWLPEEEHHVPELTDEEILEVKNLIAGKKKSSFCGAADGESSSFHQHSLLLNNNNNNNNNNHNGTAISNKENNNVTNHWKSLDLSIKKWQYDKLMQPRVLSGDCS